MERAYLWAEIPNMKTNIDLDNQSWFVGSDFNQILYPSEGSNDDGSGHDNLMCQFQDCLLQAGVFDLCYLGPCHTWTNKQPSDPIAKKLDRLLVNSYSISAHPHAIATFLPPLISDHSPCLQDLAYTLPIPGTNPFKFQNYLTKHPNFVQIMQDAWLQT